MKREEAMRHYCRVVGHTFLVSEVPGPLTTEEMCELARLRGEPISSTCSNDCGTTKTWNSDYSVCFTYERTPAVVGLVVGKSYSHCTSCDANVFGWETITVCPSCHEQFTHVVNEYAGAGNEDPMNIFAKRPDLQRMNGFEYHQFLINS
jgi:hypothetical protein